MNTSQNMNNQSSMIASKNLTMLEDELNYEILCNRKLNLYANYRQDQNLKNVCERAAQMHKQHFDQLFGYLNSHNRPQQ